MSKPNTPTMEQIEALIRDIAEMEQAISETKQLLATLPAQMATELPDESARIAAAHYLYYFVEQLSPKSIGEGLLGEYKKNVFTTIVGNAPSDVYCERCFTEIPVTSRSHLAELKRHAARGGSQWAEGYNIVCHDCRSAILIERNKTTDTWKQAYFARLEELRTMPYQDYLQTEEWKARRIKHLKSAGFRCQVCNGKGLIDIHHRTYERRGNERYTDLIALCRDCHDLFHKQGKLARD